ncbi:MAG: hypothetical protein E7Z92_00620 [Cyanobacteria bacterium SIG31]|nr:hypothetical protein [Cyanobacteria bacterium SIG31]
MGDKINDFPKIYDSLLTNLKPIAANLSTCQRTSEKLKECFSNSSESSSPTELSETIPVGEQTERARTERKALEANGSKPTMGLTQEINANKQKIADAEEGVQTASTEAENDNRAVQNEFSNTENQVEVANTAAQEKLKSTQGNTAAQNANAAEKTKRTEEETKSQIQDAKSQEAEVVKNADDSVTNAQKSVDDATETQQNAQTAYDTAQNNVRSAETALSAARAVLSSVKPENKAAAEAEVKSKEMMLNEAKQQAEAKKAELEEANKKLEESKRNLEAAKQQAETDKSNAAQNTANVTQKGQEANQAAVKNENNVKAQGEKANSAAQSNVDKTESAGAASVDKARQSVDQAKQAGEKKIETAEKKREEAKKLATTIRDMARGYNDAGEKVKFNNKEYDKAIKSINADNVKDVLNAGGSDLMNAIAGVIVNPDNEDPKPIDNKKLVERAGDDLKHVASALQEAMNKSVNEKWPQTLDKAPLINYIKTISRSVDEVLNNTYDLSEPDNRNFLSGIIVSVNESLGSLDNKVASALDALEVNGKIDERSTQKTGNCWLHGAFNSMATTEQGQKIISDNISRDPNKGITRVTLPGVNKTYEITDEDLYQATEFHSQGDADMTAYALAIDKYLKENPQMREDFKSLLNVEKVVVNDTGQGGQANFAWELMGAPKLNDDIRIDGADIPQGLSKYFKREDEDSAKKYYDNLCQLIKNGACTAVISSQGHAWSVVGIDEQGRLLIKESNNSKILANSLVGEGNYDTIYDKENEVNYVMHMDFETFFKKSSGCSTWRY